MSLYKEYVAEARGMQCLEEDWGFATFRIVEEDCYIEDIYVVPHMRQKSCASVFCNRIGHLGKSKGCKWLYTTIDCLIKDPTTSLKACLAYGFQIHKCMNDIIILRMGL